jgi:hypothetical protein
MAISSRTLKKVRQQAVVRLVGDGTSNLDLADIALDDETFDRSNSRVTINSIVFSNGSTSAPITVTRNSNLLMQLFDTDQWMMSMMHGVVEDQDANANISITIPSPGGTVIIGLTKAEGYTPPSQQEQSNLGPD